MRVCRSADCEQDDEEEGLEVEEGGLFIPHLDSPETILKEGREAYHFGSW